MESKLASSGLDLTDARIQGIAWCDTAPDGLPLRDGGIILPYHDPAGKPTGFFRFRYLIPPKLSGFKAAAPGKAIRYAQPAGTTPEVYFPRLHGGRDWTSIVQDPAQPIVLTEGELKAACATKHGFLCLGLGGVWSWKARQQGIDFLPALEAIVWKGRQVFIAFDSDAASNEKVQTAEAALARALSTRGAVVQIVRIPPIGETKCGLDDYLVAAGRDAFADLLASAPVFGPLRELYRLNEEVVYFTELGSVYRYEDGKLMKPSDFVAHQYADRVYWDISDPASPKRRSAPAEWIKWDGRAKLKGLSFVPGAPTIVDGRLNTWKGWGVQPRKGDVSLWLRLIDHLFARESLEARHWFQQWCAYPLQHPGTKLLSAVMIQGRQQGTGKTALAYMLGKLHGQGFREIKNKDLKGGFNEWAEARTLIYGDEITGGDARVDADYMKGLITQAQVSINRKYQEAYVLPDFANYIFSSNHPDALFMEDGDRRYFVCNADVDPIGKAFADEIDDWLHWEGHSGPAALMDHLLNLSLSGFNPRGKALETASKQAMIDAGRSDIGTFVARLKRDPLSVVTVNGRTRCLFTTAELLALYDPTRSTRVTANGLARELSRQGVPLAYKGQGVKLKGGSHRLWVVYGNKGVATMTGPELAAMYELERRGK